MHEVSIVQNVIETLLKLLKEEGITSPGVVKEVSLRVGALELHSKEAFEQAFHVHVVGTLLGEAQLVVEIIPGRIDCAKCGYAGEIGIDEADPHSSAPIVVCPQCGAVCPVKGGRGIEPSITLEE